MFSLFSCISIISISLYFNKSRFWEFEDSHPQVPNTKNLKSLQCNPLNLVLLFIHPTTKDEFVSKF